MKFNIFFLLLQEFSAHQPLLNCITNPIKPYKSIVLNCWWCKYIHTGEFILTKFMNVRKKISFFYCFYGRTEHTVYCHFAKKMWTGLYDGYKQFIGMRKRKKTAHTVVSIWIIFIHIIITIISINCHQLTQKNTFFPKVK